MNPMRVGDVFATASPKGPSKAIRAIEKFWSKDGEAEYSHTGIVADSYGETFEALWTGYGDGNLFDDYYRTKIIIVRYMGFAGMLPFSALQQLRNKYKGRKYPYWRLLMHVFPPLAKISLAKMPVCSELTALNAHMIGARGPTWAGVTPDMLVDEWRKWRDFLVVFEGRLCDYVTA